MLAVILHAHQLGYLITATTASTRPYRARYLHAHHTTAMTHESANIYRNATSSLHGLHQREMATPLKSATITRRHLSLCDRLLHHVRLMMKPIAYRMADTALRHRA